MTTAASIANNLGTGHLLLGDPLRAQSEAPAAAMRMPRLPVTLRRTMQAARLTAIANDPEVRPRLGGGTDPLDLQPILNNPLNLALESAHGGFVFVALEPHLYEVHSLFLPAGRGAEAHAAMREALRHLFTQTDCELLVTKVPSDNPAAAALAKAAGMSTRFVRHRAWPAEGGPHHLASLGLDIWEWTRRAPETMDLGIWFHDALNAATRAAGYDSPVHHDLDDDAHNQAVGATALMIQAGNAPKGIAMYNRWARIAGFPLAALITLTPLLLDVGGGTLVTLTIEGEMEVVACR